MMSYVRELRPRVWCTSWALMGVASGCGTATA
jgi:hypothetical protein